MKQENNKSIKDCRQIAMSRHWSLPTWKINTTNKIIIWRPHPHWETLQRFMNPFHSYHIWKLFLFLGILFDCQYNCSVFLFTMAKFASNYVDRSFLNKSLNDIELKEQTKVMQTKISFKRHFQQGIFYSQSIFSNEREFYSSPIVL